VPLLHIHAARFGFSSKWWGTFRQWQELGLSVKKRPADVRSGEWGSTIVLYKPITKMRIDEDGDLLQDKFFIMRTFVVFNADQVEGAERYQVREEATAPAAPDFGPAEELISASGADIRHEGDSAFYVPPSPAEAWPNHTHGDYITLPPKSRFDPPGSYYETAFHELAHWSEVRLNWLSQTVGYAMNELVAEMSSSFLAAELGVPQAESLENHAAYVKHWLDAMRGDSSFIFKASTQASKVADLLLSHTQQEAESSEPAIIV